MNRQSRDGSWRNLSRSPYSLIEQFVPQIVSVIIAVLVGLLLAIVVTASTGVDYRVSLVVCICSCIAFAVTLGVAGWNSLRDQRSASRQQRKVEVVDEYNWISRYRWSARRQFRRMQYHLAEDREVYDTQSGKSTVLKGDHDVMLIFIPSKLEYYFGFKERYRTLRWSALAGTILGLIVYIGSRPSSAVEPSAANSESSLGVLLVLMMVLAVLFVTVHLYVALLPDRYVYYMVTDQCLKQIIEPVFWLAYFIPSSQRSIRLKDIKVAYYDQPRGITRSTTAGTLRFDTIVQQDGWANAIHNVPNHLMVVAVLKHAGVKF